MRGRVRWLETPPETGQLGGWVDTLSVVLAPGGAAAALAAALVSWGRWSRADLRVTLVRADGERAEVEVKRLRRLDAEALPAIVGSLRSWLSGDPSVDADPVHSLAGDSSDGEPR